MKKIKLDKINLADKSSSLILNNKFHSISLGNGITNYYSNVRDLRKFLANTNSFLNSELVELNTIYIGLFSEYRNLWFYQLSKDLINEETFRKEFYSLMKNFDLIILRSNWENGNQFVFKWMFSICDSLHNVAEILERVCIRQNNYLSKRRILLFKKMAALIKYELKKYGIIKDNIFIPGPNYLKLKDKFTVILGENQDIKSWINEKAEIIAKYN